MPPAEKICISGIWSSGTSTFDDFGFEHSGDQVEAQFFALPAAAFLLGAAGAARGFAFFGAASLGARRKQQIQESFFDGGFHFAAQGFALLGFDFGYGGIDEVADHRFHVAAHIADLGVF